MAIKILFGTETGTAEHCAKTLARDLDDRGVDAAVVDMDHISAEALADEPLAVVITSTFGNGDPPVNAEALLEGLRKDRPDLSRLRFAVMGLGDSSFRHFAKCGRDFDAILGDLGGHRLFDRMDVDGDPDRSLTTFRRHLLASLDLSSTEIAPPEPASRITTPLVAGIGKWLVRLGSRWSKPSDEPRRSHPAEGRLVAVRTLTGHPSSGETRHYELDLGDAADRLVPGDSIGVYPRNAPALVHAVLDAAGTESAWAFDALSERCLRRVPARLLQHLGPEAQQIASDPVTLAVFRRNHHVLHALRKFETPIAPEALVEALPPLAPRLYSVANAVDGGRVELCIATTRYELHGILVDGVASCWLADRVSPEDTIRWYPVRNPSFHLPRDNRPLILVGPGTGIAPFRGYLQQLANDAPPRDVWLFFGHRTQDDHDLYGDELRAHLSSGVLNRYDAVWSRDGATRTYVQHRIEAHGDDIWAWLQQGARVRVCGAAQTMAPGVRAAFVAIANQQGVDGDRWLEEQLENGDYLEDVY